MRSRTANWYETAIRYDKTMDDGLQKKVTEYYVVDALSFGEAEETITKEMSSYISGEFEVKNITPATYHEVFFSDNDNDDRWYKAKVSYIDFDEKTEKEKHTNVTYLVQAGSFNGAVKNMEEAMKGSMRDFAVVNICETKFLDVYEHKG
jgi:radical SAM superfamily enzyme YgiQ (UPF0313 family)